MTVKTASLADRLIALHHSALAGVLHIGGVGVDLLAKAYGTPVYIYDAGIMRAAFRSLEDALAGFADICFSIKANPNPKVCQIFTELGAGLEVASGGEFAIAQRAGCRPEDILFAGPAKGDIELRDTVAAGIGEVHLESFEEIERLSAICEVLKRTVKVAIRVNPEAAVQGGAMRMGGTASAFGFDEDQLADVVTAVLSHERLHLSGVHMFAGTQILDAQILLRQWAHGLAVAGRVAALAEQSITTIDLGGGLGVPYFEGNSPLDMAALRASVQHLKAQQNADPRLASARVIVEPGRYLTASAGVYVMQVRAAKSSHGERFVICDGGMHHHLAASGNLGQVIKRDYPIVAATNLNQPARGPATIAGPLCTPLDAVGRNTALPDMKAGDLVAILQSGAYGLTASPSNFLSHPMPKEVLVDNGGHCQI